MSPRGRPPCVCAQISLPIGTPVVWDQAPRLCPYFNLVTSLKPLYPPAATFSLDTHMGGGEGKSARPSRGQGGGNTSDHGARPRGKHIRAEMRRRSSKRAGREGSSDETPGRKDASESHPCRRETTVSGGWGYAEGGGESAPAVLGAGKSPAGRAEVLGRVPVACWSCSHQPARADY